MFGSATTASRAGHNRYNEGNFKGQYPDHSSMAQTQTFTQEEKKLIWAFFCYIQKDCHTNDWKPRIDCVTAEGKPEMKMKWLRGQFSSKEKDCMQSTDAKLKPKRDGLVKDLQHQIDKMMLPPKLIGRIFHLATRGEKGTLPLGPLEYLLGANYLGFQGLKPPNGWDVDDVEKDSFLWVEEVQDAYWNWIDSDDEHSEWPNAKNKRLLLSFEYGQYTEKHPRPQKSSDGDVNWHCDTCRDPFRE